MDLASLTGRLPPNTVSVHPAEIAKRSRDWWALAMLRERRGDPSPRAEAVVFPRTTDQVAATLAWAEETRTPVVPRGGGSGVVGGAVTASGGIVLDLSEMRRVISIDEESLAVTVEAGVLGGDLEDGLGERGLTLGHYPQSIMISTVGGWIAARSAGQASAGYGAIEDLILGLTAVLPGGLVVSLRPAPRSAAGPDLRQLFAGSEGTLGVVTEAVLSVSRRPSGLRWLAVRPPGFAEGMTLARRVTQGDLRPLVLRVYDEADAALTFGALGDAGGCVLIAAMPEEGPGAEARFAGLGAIAREAGTEPLPEAYGTHWWEHRLDAVDLYRRVMGEERMLGEGVVVDTMEVAALWSRMPELYGLVGAALAEHAEAVGCHLSHPYRSGASLYFTFLVRAEDDRAVEEPYLQSWSAAARACHRAGGTVTHHHGVGLLKTAFMKAELGRGGLALLRTVKRAVDPRGVMNPGKLLPDA
ncbi:MAG TPA: FAD-binding oxidoreductase [Actinomycetota bacterium]